MEKVAVQVSDFMYEVLQEDSRIFKLEVGAIGNRILKYYLGEKVNKYQSNDKNKKKIQFNLTKYNDGIFMKHFEDFNDGKNLSKSDYVRSLIFAYINNPRYKREEILFEENFKILREAISKNKKIILKYFKEVRKVNPYFIKISNTENKNYLFCYSDDSKDYRTYGLNEISDISLLDEDLEYKNKEYIDDIRSNFDPFRSYGHKVKVKISDEGIRLLDKIFTNRPKILEKETEKNIYTFECSERLAQVYFPQFLNEIEILEPENLRTWFKEIHYKVYQIYNK